MEAVKRADSREEILRHLIEQYEVSLKRMCCLYLGDAALAEDAVQETFIKAYAGLSGFRGEASVKTWLVRIALNTCKDMLRGGWLRHVDHNITLDKLPQPQTEDVYGQAELTMLVMRLPRKYKEIVLLHCYQGMTTRETAKALGIPQQTVVYRMKIAREKLRMALEGGSDHEE